MPFASVEEGQIMIDDWLDSPLRKIKGTFLHLDTIIISSGSMKYHVIQKMIQYNQMQEF